VTTQGNEAVVRPIAAEDYVTMFEWYGDTQCPHYWNFDRRILTFRAFRRRMSNLLTRCSVLIICRSSDSEPVGYCQLYDIRPWDGWAICSVYLVSGARDPLFVEDVLHECVQTAFATYPLRKLYLEVPAFAPHLLMACDQLGFEEQGSISDYYWFAGRLWPFKRMAVYRDVWEARSGRRTRLAKKDKSLPTA